MKTLPSNWIAQAYAILASEEAEREHKQREYQRYLEQNPHSADEKFNLILSALDAINPGDLDHGDWVSIGMALASEGDNRLEEAWIQWSASSSKCTSGGRTAAKKWRSFKRSGYTIGTLFYFAKQDGWKFPERKYQDPREPDPIEYQRLLDKEAERNRVEQAQVNWEGFSRLKQWLKSLQKQFTVKGFGKQSGREQQTQVKPQIDTINYLPGKLHQPGYYPTPVKIRYKPKQLSQLLIEARALGWKDILDTSQAGEGKSHRYPLLPLDVIGVKQCSQGEAKDKTMHRAWLLCQSHRNPTTVTAEANYTDLVVRNSGFVQDSERKTALGNPHLRHPKPGESPMTEGNCHMAKLIHMAQAKGIQSARGSTQSTPFCKDWCQDRFRCGKSRGNGYGFLDERAEVFKHATKIRASIESLPNQEQYTAYSGDVAILDEPLQQLKPVRTISASLQDIDSQWAELEQKLPEIYDQLNLLRRTLRSLVSGSEQHYHGFDDIQLRERLPAVPDGFESSLNIIREVMAFINFGIAGEEPDTASTQEDTKDIASLRGTIARQKAIIDEFSSDLLELQNIEADLKAASYQHTLGVEFQGFRYSAGEAQNLLETMEVLPRIIADFEMRLEQSQDALKKLERERQKNKDFNRPQFQDAKERIDEMLQNLPNQWLIPCLEVWSNEKPGALRIGKFGSLTISFAEKRHNDILDSFNTRFYLDATSTPQILAFYRQIPLSQILWIEQESSKTNNLDFVWVNGLGLAGKQRSECCDERIKILNQYLKNKHQDLVVFDHLSKKNITDADGWWWGVDVRGSNRFKDRSAIAAYGLPMPDVATFSDLWLTLTKAAGDESVSFDDFYRQLIDAEIIQAVGRLRAVRRPEETLTFYLIGDTEKSRVANYQPPAQLNPRRIELRDLCPAAASKSEQAWLGIWEVIQRWWSEHGELPTQAEVSQQTGNDRSWISKLAAHFIGGWKCLKKIIQSLVDPPYSRWNLIDSLPEDFEWFAKTFLPLVAQQPSLEIAQELNSLLQIYGWRGWVQILSQTSQSLRLSLIAALFRDGLVTQELTSRYPHPNR